MKFSETLKQGVFLKRYKRFFADFTVNSKTEVAHVANTGSMKGLLNEGSPCLVRFHSDPKRKLKYSLEALADESKGWVGVNTQIPNQLIKETLIEKKRKEWASFTEITPEFSISKETRLDFKIENKKSKKIRYIEVKNVTLKIDDCAAFPDSVTERGQKHLIELMKLMDEGFEAEIVFLVQRTDCKKFRAAREIDPKYAELLIQAKKKGMIITPLVARFSPEGVELTGEVLPLESKM